MNSPIAFRVKPGHPCPVCCTDTKGCSATTDGLHFCRSEPADPCAWRLVERGEEFNLFRRVKDCRPDRQVTTKNDPAIPVIDWMSEAETYAKNMTGELWKELSQQLGLTAKSLMEKLPLIGWSGSAWTFPECDGSGRIIGILKRDRAGKKRMQPGSKRGLTTPARWEKRASPALVVEGPTCAIAVSSAGLAAIGRPSSSGGVELLADLFANYDPGIPIIILGENDKKPDGRWPGRDGAMTVANELAARQQRPIQLAFPPRRSEGRA